MFATGYQVVRDAMNVVAEDRLDRRLRQDEVSELVDEYKNVRDGSFAVRAILLTQERNQSRANEVLAMANAGLLRSLGNAPGAAVDARLITGQTKDDAYIQISDKGTELARLAVGTCGSNTERLEELLVRRLKTEIECIALRSGADELVKRTVIVEFTGGSKRTLAA
tara:strand:- start:1123 stop:1623 length:501 start_codon:yes stop_codon:yes gene_type:complete